MLQSISGSSPLQAVDSDDREGGAPAAALGGRPRVLLLDADREFRQRTSKFLSEHGFAVLEADNAVLARELLARYGADVVVLDIRIPDEDGLAMARAFSLHLDVSVIVVSEIGSEIDRIVGLEAGADDYLTKPVSLRELLARIRAVRRRAAAKALFPEPSDFTCYSFAGWNFDVERRVLRDPGGTDTPLSEGEYSLLRTFVERPQRVLTRDQLLEYSRGANSDAYDRAIDTQISRLRRKLGNEHDNLIRTVRNEGYMFVPKVTLRG